MEQVKLNSEQYKMVLSLIKISHCDFTHCERVLNEVNWNAKAAEAKLEEEKRLFGEGKIKFDARKNII